MNNRKNPKDLLLYLNSEYFRLHKTYEDLFWISSMGDHSVNKKRDAAFKEKSKFSSDSKLRAEVIQMLANASKEEEEKLKYWLRYFDCYQIPPKLQKKREEITRLQTVMDKKVTERKEGYIDPKTKKFVKASYLKMSGMMRSDPDEAVRKACFNSKESYALTNIQEYVKFVKKLNEYARVLGFEDFYAYKIFTEEGMTKKELFGIFDPLYKKTKFAFKNVRNLEKTKPGLRKPWNFSYMMSGDFAREEDQYFPFEKALERWGKSFESLGINFHGATLTLDLLDRKGKFNNGFCHWPEPIHFVKGRRSPGSSNFTCNVVYGQVDSAKQGYDTLFHEGGHAAHFLNSNQTEVCLNVEYPPMSTAWAETQSMFLDTVFISYEWRSRYAENEKGEAYPFDLFKRRTERLHALSPLALNGILQVSYFEKEIYEEKNLTPKKVIEIAKKNYKKFNDYSENSLWLLSVPHIYVWDNACSYHGYALAELALAQWREYFYDKYGYIVDNQNVGKEMKKVWELAAAKTFKEFVPLATGKVLSPEAWIHRATRTIDEKFEEAKKRAARLKKILKRKGSIDLNAKIRMVSGKTIVADNSKSFEDMSKKYAQWLKKQKSEAK